MKEFVAGFTQDLLEAHHVVMLAKENLIRRWPHPELGPLQDNYQEHLRLAVEELLCGKYPGVTIHVEVLDHVAGIYLSAPSWKPPHRMLKKFVIINKE